MRGGGLAGGRPRIDGRVRWSGRTVAFSVVVAVVAAFPVLLPIPSVASFAPPSSLGSRAVLGPVHPSLPTPNFLAGHAVGWSSLVAPPAGFGSGGGLFVDSSTGSAVAFGGISSGSLVNSTFVYAESTNRWSSLTPAVAPSPRSDFASDFDPALRVGALFGGMTNLSTLADSNQTWEYNSSGVWRLVATPVAPPAREDAAFAIDPNLGVGFLFGGWNRSFSRTSSVTYSDLWELNLTTWTWSSVTVVGASPPPLEGSSMTWDAATGSLDLFGGCYPCSPTVWELDPSTLSWRQQPSVPGAPAGRSSPSWGYDPALGDDLLFGGTTGVAWFNDTYLYNSTQNLWVSETLAPHPDARYAAASGFLNVPGNQTWLLAGGISGFGEYTDTWRLSATSNVSLRVVNASAPSSPLAGVEVNLSGLSVGATNASGFLNLTQVNAEDQPLNLTDDPWFFPLYTTVWLPPGVASSLLLALSPEPLGSVFALVNTTDGVPLAGAYANLSIDGVRVNPTPHQTDATGNVTFRGVPPGRANVTASLPDWRDGYANGTEPPGGNLNVTIELVPDPILTVNILGRLPAGLTVPLDNAGVYVDGVYVGFTSSSGVLVVVTSDYGLTNVYATASGFQPGVGYMELPWTGNASTTLVLSSLPYGTLIVEVQDGKSGEPIPGATVTASTRVPLAWGNIGESNNTNAQGYTEFGLPEGQYNVDASATGYLSNPVASGALVVPGQTTEITVFLQRVPPGNLSIHVRDARTHAPIVGANVSAPGQLTGLTNASGYFNATDVLPGSFFFSVTAVGYLPNSTYVDLSSYENLSVEVNLTPLPRVQLVSTGWAFDLFPGGLLELWPFFLLPVFLLVGGFLYASVRRALPTDEETTRRPLPVPGSPPAPAASSEPHAAEPAPRPGPKA